MEVGPRSLWLARDGGTVGMEASPRSSRHSRGDGSLVLVGIGPHTRGRELKKSFMCVHEGKVFIRVLIITNWIDEVK